MTAEEFDAELHRVMAMEPLERAAAYVPLMQAARAALSQGRAQAMREAVDGGMTRTEVARKLRVNLAQVSKAIGEPSGPGKRGRPRKD